MVHSCFAYRPAMLDGLIMVTATRVHLPLPPSRDMDETFRTTAPSIPLGFAANWRWKCLPWYTQSSTSPWFWVLDGVSHYPLAWTSLNRRGFCWFMTNYCNPSFNINWSPPYSSTMKKLPTKQVSIKIRSLSIILTPLNHKSSHHRLS